MRLNIIKNKAIDEMQERLMGRAGIICVEITILYLIIECIYKYITTKDILNCTWEIGLILIIAVVFRVITRNDKEMNLPKSILGKRLPTEQTKGAKMKRVFAYLCDSMIFTTVQVIFTYILDSESPTYILIEAIMIFTISFVIDYKMGEKRCRSYEEWESSLDEEE